MQAHDDGPVEAVVPDTAGADMAARLQFLVSPALHAGSQGPARLTETHMSWLVLDDHQVLKLKKPVCYPPFLDLRTLAQRERDARAELQLNRRLAPDVYLGLMALQWHGSGYTLVPEEALPAAGQTVDWLVRMRRLAADRMLDATISAGRLQASQIEGLARVLARFYQQARPADIDAGDYLARFRDEQRRNRSVLSDPVFDLVDAARALDALDDALERQAATLGQRASLHHVVDGHGDLRPEHVCLEDPPLVIDGLTFCELLRQVDPFEELTALALDCEYLGAAWVGPLLIERCAQRLDDDPAPALLQLYRLDRALLRARLAVNHLFDPSPHNQARWLAKARDYLALALQPLP